MANHNNPIPSYMDKDYITKILQNYLKAPRINVLDVNFTPGSTVGDNYCCQIWRIKVNFLLDGKKQDMSIIAKVTPETKTLDSIKELFDVFDVEASLFDKVLPIFRKHSKDELNFAPNCYHVDFEHKVIFMEDLKVAKYVLQPRGQFLDLKQCRLVMEALACFHGASYYAVQEDPSLKETYSKSFWDGSHCDMTTKFTSNAQKGLENHIRKYGLSEKDAEKLLKFKDRFFGPELEVLRKKDESLNFLLHGDCWMNNMLFHYNEENHCDSVKLLDYQIVYYNSFANDLHYFLFSSAHVDVIVNNLDELLEVYYNKLSQIAPDIPNLTLERVKEEFYERKFFGYLLGVCFRPFIVTETPPDIDNILDGQFTEDMGFESEKYISDLKKLLPLFKKLEIF